MLALLDTAAVAAGLAGLVIERLLGLPTAALAGPAWLLLAVAAGWRRLHVPSVAREVAAALQEPAARPGGLPLLAESGVAMAEMLRAGRCTSAALVDRCIRQVEAVNPKLNAMVADRFAAARAEAAAADLELAAARRAGAAALAALAAAKPFCGVPCVLKECFEVPGMPNSAGLVARVGVVGAGAASSWGPGGSKDPLRLGKVP